MNNYSDEIKKLVKKCEDFIESLYIYSHNNFSFSSREHKACFIDCIDADSLLFQKENFIKHLISSITDYVYTDNFQGKIIDDVNGSGAQKSNALFYQAKQTFRKPRYIIPNSIPIQQADSELISNFNETDIRLFSSIYKLNNKKTSYCIENYSIEKAKEIISVFIKHNFDYRQIISQGQFSELLLYNILMNEFNAVPLVHKMPITTNPQFERHGIDAIHLADSEEGLELFIGESKAYNRKQGSFKAAIIDSLNDVINHHENLVSELSLYRYSEHISEGLENFLNEFLKGKHKDIKINLICMVSYTSSDENVYCGREEFILKTKEMIENDCRTISKENFNDLEDVIINKVIFVLFPIREMNEIIVHFQSEVGMI